MFVCTRNVAKFATLCMKLLWSMFDRLRSYIYIYIDIFKGSLVQSIDLEVNCTVKGTGNINASRTSYVKPQAWNALLGRP